MGKEEGEKRIEGNVIRRENRIERRSKGGAKCNEYHVMFLH